MKYNVATPALLLSVRPTGAPWCPTAIASITQERIDRATTEGVSNSHFVCAHTIGAAEVPDQGNPAEWGRPGGYAAACAEARLFQRVLSW